MPNKTCCFHGCKSDSRKKIEGIAFIPFPKPSKYPEHARRWVSLSGRDDFTVDRITRNTFICNQHFPRGENLNLKENPGLEPRPAHFEENVDFVVIENGERRVWDESEEDEGSAWNLGEILEAFQDITYLNTTVMGTDWIVIQRDGFDVFMEEQPYTNLQILVNLVTKLYIVRVWGRTSDQGIISSREELRDICIDKFDFSVVCKGITEWMDDDIQFVDTAVHVDYPVPRYVSKECKEMFSLGHSNHNLNSSPPLALCEPCLRAQNSVVGPSTSTNAKLQQPMETQESDPLSDEDLLRTIKCEVELNEEFSVDTSLTSEHEDVETRLDSKQLSDVQHAKTLSTLGGKMRPVKRRNPASSSTGFSTLPCKCGGFASKVSEKKVASGMKVYSRTMSGNTHKVEERFKCAKCKALFMRVNRPMKKYQKGSSLKS